MLLSVLQQPEPLLCEKSIKIDKITPELKELAMNMLETMYAINNGVGLSAVQVGKLYRLFVYDISAERNEPQVLFNPELVSHNNETEKNVEGCLSCRGFEGLVKRYTKVTVRCLNLKGKKVTIKADGLLSRVLQHELDHLDGISITEKSEPVPPDMQSAEEEPV
jgi:peptide deformylase